MKIGRVPRGELGGKANGLYLAMEVLDSHREAGTFIRIPEFVVLPAEMYKEFCRRNDLDPATLAGEVDYPTLRRHFLQADLPDAARERLAEIVDRWEFPLAVRSSSVLEDRRRFSMAGKYLTRFLPNRGSRSRRRMDLERAVKEVYASTWSPAAVAYRRKHALPEDCMAVVIQRLVGQECSGYWFPEIAGVGYSHNFRPWSPRIRPEDGVLRLVFGLGTRSTGRGYARIASLSNPDLRPEGHDPEDVARFSQENYDILDLRTGLLRTVNVNHLPELVLAQKHYPCYLQVYSFRQEALLRPDASTRPRGGKFVLTFHGASRCFPGLFAAAARTFRMLEEVMGGPVDVEFAYVPAQSTFWVLQARPLGMRPRFREVRVPGGIPNHRVLLRGSRMLTHGVVRDCPAVVYVDPAAYAASDDKYGVARTVGELNRLLAGSRYILVGPGRWGSTDPLFGVPVSYEEICHAGLLVEIGGRGGAFTPELSYGTHFFADLEAEGILYMPVFTHLEDDLYNAEWFYTTPAETTGHPAVALYRGRFDAYLDGYRMKGLVVAR